jgi:hypothetical protein
VIAFTASRVLVDVMANPSSFRPFTDEVGRFRHQLNDLGRIAWPLRSSGKLKRAEVAGARMAHPRHTCPRPVAKVCINPHS